MQYITYFRAPYGIMHSTSTEYGVQKERKARVFSGWFLTSYHGLFKCRLVYLSSHHQLPPMPQCFNNASIAPVPQCSNAPMPQCLTTTTRQYSSAFRSPAFILHHPSTILRDLCVFPSTTVDANVDATVETRTIEFPHPIHPRHRLRHRQPTVRPEPSPILHYVSCIVVEISLISGKPCKQCSMGEGTPSPWLNCDWMSIY